MAMAEFYREAAESGIEHIERLQRDLTQSLNAATDSDPFQRLFADKLMQLGRTMIGKLRYLQSHSTTISPQEAGQIIDSSNGVIAQLTKFLMNPTSFGS